jgi:peptidyl-prolyl cis-trans isomerase C
MVMAVCVVAPALVPCEGYAEDKVLAKIGDKAITEAELNQLASAVPERLRYLYLTPEGKSQTLDYIVNVYVMAAQAEKDGMDKDPTFQALLNFTKKDLLARLYLEKSAKKLPEPTEKEAKEYYDKNAAQFATPDSVHLRHILVKTDKEAEDVLKRLKKGEKFEELAAKVSTCPSKDAGGDLDWMPRGRLTKELEDAAFGMEKGQLGGPIKTRFGFHVLYLEDKKAAGQSSFEDVKDFIMEQLRYQQQQDHYQKVAESLRKAMNVTIAAPTVEPVGAAPQPKPGAPAAPGGVWRGAPSWGPAPILRG